MCQNVNIYKITWSYSLYTLVEPNTRQIISLLFMKTPSVRKITYNPVNVCVLTSDWDNWEREPWPEGADQLDVVMVTTVQWPILTDQLKLEELRWELRWELGTKEEIPAWAEPRSVRGEKREVRIMTWTDCCDSVRPRDLSWGASWWLQQVRLEFRNGWSSLITPVSTSTGDSHN